jgi:hypothetical protein
MGDNLRNNNNHDQGKKMKKENEEAFKVVSQACAVYQGQLQEHQAIQTALNTIREALTPEQIKEQTPIEELREVLKTDEQKEA